MTAIGDLVVNLSANRDKFSRELKGARGELQGFASFAGKALGALGAGFSIGGVVAGVASMVNQYRDAEQASRKLDAVLRATGNAAGLTGDEIRDYAGELQNLTNFDADDTTGAAAVLATFKNIKGDTFLGAIAAMQDMSAVMRTDLQGSAVQLGKALNDPVKGITALTRVGVSFTDQQKEQIKALQESGDLLGAQQIILAELQSEFGGAAQAMADPIVQAQNAIGDLSETIGGEFAPYVKLAATELRGYVQAGASGIATTGALGEMVGLLADELQLVINGWRTFDWQLAGAAAGFANAEVNARSLWAALTGDDSGLEDAKRRYAQAAAAFVQETLEAREEIEAKPVSMQAADIAQRHKAAMAEAAAMNGEYADSFDAIGDKADANGKRVQDMLDAAIKKVEQFGMTDEQKAIADMAALGASDEELGAMVDAQRRIADDEERKKAQEEADRLKERYATTDEKIAAAREKYDPLLEKGLITQGTYDRAIADLQDKPKRDAKEGDLFGGALRQDSTDAWSAITANMARTQNANRDPLVQAKKHTELLAELNKRVDELASSDELFIITGG